MKAPAKFRFTREPGSYEGPYSSTYLATRIEDGRILGTVWRDRSGWNSRFSDGLASRDAAARSISAEYPVETKSKVWVSVVHEGRSISFIAEVLDSDVAALDPTKVFHGSCAITFEGRGIIAGHLWAVDETKKVEVES